MSIPTSVKANVEDSVVNSGLREVWPTTDEPTSPLWRFAFHQAAVDRSGSSWKGAGFVSCTAAEHYNVISYFAGLVAKAAEVHAQALLDPEIVKVFSDEPDGKFPFLAEEGRYSIPSS